MKIILTKDVADVGRRYETKNIADGYALNFLIPKGLAVIATPEAVKKIDAIRGREEGEKRVHEELLLKNLTELDGATVTITEKATPKGSLFAGVHKAEIIPEIQKQTRLQISPEFIVLEKPIKEVGEHLIEVKVKNKSVKFKLVIKAK
jgi:large subunit ribosomal protein L9